MRILVIDKYNHPRDLAQMDMYYALKEKYDVIFANSENIMTLITEDQYDYLYLGIYHPWCGKLDWKLIFSINKKPIIIDQADNDGFMYRIASNFKYEGNCILLSRYLPYDKLNNIWKGKIQSLPWYINPERFQSKEKTIDVSFVCTININRLGTDRKKLSKKVFDYCENNNLSYKIGEYWGDQYNNIITSSKSMIVDGSRYCLTQKYIEAALSNCLIIGEKPISPPNDFITLELNDINLKTNDYDDILSFNRNYALETFANKDKFIDNFNNIISNF